MDPIDLIKTECLRRLRENQEKINTVLTGLPEEDLWWRPNPESNSIGNLLLHLSGNLTQYVLSSLGGQADHRERSKEFAADGGIHTPDLLKKFNDVMEAVYTTILSCGEMELTRVRPVQCYQETGIGILVHVTEHLSYHTGQIIYLIKWKKGKALGFYSDSMLEQKK
jgi:uncharacterized damage-inducible protein DinB